MKIPLALAKAADASLPTLVDAGRLFFRMRRTQAKGGSNSTADGGPFVALVGSVDVPVVATTDAVVVVVAAAVLII